MSYDSYNINNLCVKGLIGHSLFVHSIKLSGFVGRKCRLAQIH